MSNAIEIPARPTSPRPEPITFECPTCGTAHVGMSEYSLDIRYCDECGRATCMSCGDNRDECELCGKMHCFKHIHLIGEAPRPGGTADGPCDSADPEEDLREMLCTSCAVTPRLMREVGNEHAKPSTPR